MRGFCRACLSGKASKVRRAMRAGRQQGELSHSPSPWALTAQPKCSFIFRKLTSLSRLRLKILIKRPPVPQNPNLWVSINFLEPFIARYPAKHKKHPSQTTRLASSISHMITKASSKWTPWQEAVWVAGLWLGTLKKSLRDAHLLTNSWNSHIPYRPLRRICNVVTSCLSIE